MRKQFNIILLIAALQVVKAQDYHVSQYDVAALYLNPATAGVDAGGKGGYRLYADQRSQWRSAGIKPFVTSFLGFDMPYKIKGKKIGVGAYLLNNNAGLGNFNTFSFMAGASYDILGKKEKVVSSGQGGNNHLLCVGLQLGLFYRSTNSSALSYDAQYSPATNNGDFDRGLPSYENTSRLNITRFDANYGLYYRYLRSGSRYRPYAGFSMSHLTQPNEAMVGGIARQSIRTSLYGGCDVQISEKISITPRFLFHQQARAKEMMPGILAYYRLSEQETKLLAGFDLRVHDACVVSLGYVNRLLALRFSYDINTSYLKQYTNGRGAYEISLVYSGKKLRSQEAAPPAGE